MVLRSPEVGLLISISSVALPRVSGQHYDSHMTPNPEGNAVRLDKWLWAARFFKTRSVAADAIGGGKVQLNGRRVKRAHLVHVGDELRVRKGPFEHCVVVRQLSERRGPAKEAQQLYDETEESRLKRDTLAIQLKSVPANTFRTKGRPTKKERREIDRFRRGKD